MRRLAGRDRVNGSGSAGKILTIIRNTSRRTLTHRVFYRLHGFCPRRNLYDWETI